MWNTLKRLADWLDEILNPGNDKALLEFARVALDEALAQLAQAEIELADKAFYVREFAAVSQERDGFKAQLQRAKDHNQTITEGYKEEIAALRERAEQAEAERDDLQYETPIIRELRAILGLAWGDSITERCKELAGLAGDITTGAAIQQMHDATCDMTRGEALGAVLDSEDAVPRWLCPECDKAVWVESYCDDYPRCSECGYTDAPGDPDPAPKYAAPHEPASDDVDALARAIKVYMGEHPASGWEGMARAAIAHMRKRAEQAEPVQKCHSCGAPRHAHRACVYCNPVEANP